MNPSCTRHGQAGDDIGNACLDCGHSLLVHPGGMNSAVTSCVLCRLENIITALADTNQVPTATATPDHLQVTTTDREFDHLPPIQSTYGDEFRAYESSAAEGPCIWLAITMRDSKDVHAHLTAENAWHLAEQIMTLVRDHYQGDARPEQRIADLIAHTELDLAGEQEATRVHP